MALLVLVGRKDFRLTLLQIGKILDGGVGDNGHLGAVTVTLLQQVDDFRPAVDDDDLVLRTHPVQPHPIHVRAERYHPLHLLRQCRPHLVQPATELFAEAPRQEMTDLSFGDIAGEYLDDRLLWNKLLHIGKYEGTSES